MSNLTLTEKSVLRQIRKFTNHTTKRYDFWFTYDDNDNARNWEGGFELPLDKSFRNDYSLLPDKTLRKNHII